MSGKVLSFKDKVLPIVLPKLFDHVSPFHCYITWKINVKEVLSEDCFVELIVETDERYVSYIIFINIKVFKVIISLINLIIYMI